MPERALPSRTGHKPAASTTAPSDTAGAVAELIEEVGSILHSRSFASGLNPAQWAALRYFARANPSARTATAFARAHRATIGTATQTISAVVRKGYLVRVPSEEDRRSARLDVNQTGLKLLAAHDPLNAIARAIDKLPETPKQALVEGLEILSRALLEEDGAAGS